MTECRVISFLVSETPLAVTRLVLPPASVLMIIFAWAPIHLPHSPLIFSSVAFLSFGSVADQACMTEGGTRYKTTNFLSFELVILMSFRLSAMHHRQSCPASHSLARHGVPIGPPGHGLDAPQK